MKIYVYVCVCMGTHTRTHLQRERGGGGVTFHLRLYPRATMTMTSSAPPFCSRPRSPRADLQGQRPLATLTSRLALAGLPTILAVNAIFPMRCDYLSPFPRPRPHVALEGGGGYARIDFPLLKARAARVQRGASTYVFRGRLIAGWIICVSAAQTVSGDRERMSLWICAWHIHDAYVYIFKQDVWICADGFTLV